MAAVRRGQRTGELPGATSPTTRTTIFAFLSLRAWNAWWLVQEAAAGGGFIADDVAFLGPLTLRHVGYAVTGLLQLVIAVSIVRDPRPRTLVLGLAASVLVIFAFMTQMHERYAFGALIFLMLLIPEPRIRWLAIAFGIVFTLNLLAAAPPTPEIGAALPVAGTTWGRRICCPDPRDVDRHAHPVASSAEAS